jgi:hypothetical protein
MIKAMLISAIAVATLFSRPYIVGTDSLVIAADHIVSSLAETALPPSNSSTRDKIILSQVVNRSLKSDRLMMHRTAHQGPEHNHVQTPVSPNQKIKIGCERPFSPAVGIPAVSVSDMIVRCIADAGRLHHASG